MFELQGKYTNAKVFTDNIDNEAISQIIQLCSQEFMKNSKVRIQPDVHAGVGVCIGTTLTIEDKVVPNLVGVDIGCGMFVSKIKEKDLDVVKLDKVIRKFVPSGMDVREKEHKFVNKVNLEDLKCRNHISLSRAKLSLGTLGGGNHFIECCRNEAEEIYIVIHSGSRYLGKQVAKYYQELAYEELASQKDVKEKIIKELKAQGRAKEIQAELLKIKAPKICKSLAYLQGKNCLNYLYDMRIVQNYATYNRKAMMDVIVREMGLTVVEEFTTIHNYIDVDEKMLRKGAISAKKGEKVIIPINMKEGSLIAVGKGNEDWNCSAPHGAGRLYPRGVCKERFSLEEYEESMKGIYTTSVGQGTLDECPMAYKPIEEIIENTKETIDILEIIRPIYNFKSS